MIYHERVPRGIKENLAYRKKVLVRAATDIDFRSAVWAACRDDILYWVNTFLWLFEPRPMVGADGKPLPKKIPFITWPHQEPAIREIDRVLGTEDVAVEKARGEGMSWIMVTFGVRDFIFRPMSTIGFVSKDEASVDTPDNSDSLFWKVQFLLDNLPSWMVPKYNRSVTAHTFKNTLNGSSITGFAATGNVASGGRATWFGMDELSKFPKGKDADAMASTQHVTKSRFVVATPFGTDGEYYRLMHEPSSMVKITVDWKDNPTKNRGLYRMQNGLPVAVDKANPLPVDYDPLSSEVLDRLSRLRRKGFKLDNTIRSPWYDKECDRPSATPQKIAQELDRSYGGSMYRIFGNEFFDEANKTVQNPVKYSISVNPEKIEGSLSKVENGPVLVWCSLDAKNKPAERQYVLGADISAGLGGSHTSNSVCQIVDLLSGEQVLEYATNTTSPADFADECVALAKIFNNARMIWEANGVGMAFMQKVLESGYTNYYMREVMWKRKKSRQKEAGWWTNDKTKEILFEYFQSEVKSGRYVLRSDSLVKECGQYIRENGKIEHVLSRGSDDGSSKGAAHGDRVIAMGIALQAARERPLAQRTEEKYMEDNPPPNTLAARNKEWEERNSRGQDTWDDRDCGEMARAPVWLGSDRTNFGSEW
jgi:hypothetical protein